MELDQTGGCESYNKWPGSIRGNVTTDVLTGWLERLTMQCSIGTMERARLMYMTCVYAHME